MATIGQHISNIRGILMSYSRTPESHTDQFLYEILSGARAEIVKNKLRQENKLSESFYQRFCMQLEVVSAEDCSCVPDEIACKVLRTKYKLPQVFTKRNTDVIQVFLLNGKQISILPISRWRYNKKSTEYIASFINGYLYFWNLPLHIKVIEIVAAFVNPTDLEDIQSCDPLGNNEHSCFSILTSEFPLEEEYKIATYKRALELLGIQVNQDLTNDSNKKI